MRNVRSQDNADSLEHTRTKMSSALYQLGHALASCRQHHKREAKEASWVSPQRGNLTPCQGNTPLPTQWPEQSSSGHVSQKPGIVYYSLFCIWTPTAGQGVATCSNPSDTTRQTRSYFFQPEAAHMGGNSSRLLRFSWPGGDLAETRGTSLRFLLPPLHDPPSLFASSSSARERPRSRATCRPEAPAELLPFLRPRLTGRASGVAVRKLPRLAFWEERLSPWWSTGLCPKLGLLLETTLGKSP